MFQNLKEISLDPIFEMFGRFNADLNPNKVNLAMGVYSDMDGSPFVFPSVKKSAQEVDLDNFDYQPIQGMAGFLEGTAKLFLGEDFSLENIALQATCGGAHSCRVFADIMERAERKKILFATPTWVNHAGLFKHLNIETFEHLDEKKEVSFENYIQAVEMAEEYSILLIQGGKTHNPTGKNLTVEELKELIPLLNKKNMMLFIDCAYFGLGDGIDEDRKMLRMAFQECDHCAMGVSYSKNASLYEQRTGCLLIKSSPAKVRSLEGFNTKDLLESNLRNLIREEVSTPPGFGQEVMANVFQNHFDTWKNEVDEVRKNIQWSRDNFLSHFDQFSDLREGRGLFGMLDITLQQIEKLSQEHSVYLINSGRINFSGIKPSNLEYVKEAFQKIL